MVHTDDSTRSTTHWASCELPDDEIVALVLGGNDAAYEAIMRRYNRLLFRLARGITSTNEDAQDVVQESYVRAYFRLSQFKGPTGFASWISRIVINEAISRSRKKTLLVDSNIEMNELATDRKHRPEELAMGQDTLGLIESAIDSLPPDFRVVFMLRGVEELSINETAELLDINPATVKTRFHRARGLIRKALTHRIGDAVPGTFSFDGERCDRIVDNVFARTARTPR